MVVVTYRQRATVALRIPQQSGCGSYFVWAPIMSIHLQGMECDKSTLLADKLTDKPAQTGLREVGAFRVPQA